MKRLAHVLVVVAALFIAASFLWFFFLMIDLTLDYPTRLAGDHPEYPPEGTFAYYWVCAVAICRGSIVCVYPFGILAVTALLAVAQLFWSRLSAYRTSSRFGFAFLLLVTLIYGRLLIQGDMTFERFLFLPFPAPILLLIRRSWPHALFLLSCWAGCTLIASGVSSWHGWAGFFRQEKAPFIAYSLAILFIHGYLILRHDRELKTIACAQSIKGRR